MNRVRGGCVLELQESRCLACLRSQCILLACACCINGPRYQWVEGFPRQGPPKVGFSHQSDCQCRSTTNPFAMYAPPESFEHWPAVQSRTRCGESTGEVNGIREGCCFDFMLFQSLALRSLDGSSAFQVILHTSPCSIYGCKTIRRLFQWG